MRVRSWMMAVMALAVAGIATGCHSYHVETEVENRTGGTIQLLEVDYPSASSNKTQPNQ